MEKSIIKSTIISELEKIKLNSEDALDNFWMKINSEGSPIIESLANDPDNNLVTFIYKGELDVHNVLCLPEIEDGQSLNYHFENMLDTNLWYLTCKIRNDIRFEYWLSVNDSLNENWDEREDELIYDKLNKKYLFVEGEDGEEDEILSHVIMPKAEEHIWVVKNENVPEGMIDEIKFKSKHFEEDRRIRIYTPYGYNKNNEYKFMILTDGDEYLSLLSAQNVIDNLIADKKIPPVIVLYIDSMDDRDEELACSDNFVDVLSNEIIPWFRSNYSISHSSENGIIGGLSLGGLTASYLGLKKSEIFGNVLSQSGSYWYKPENYELSGENCWISTEFNNSSKLPLKFYLNVGILEEKDNMIGTNSNFKETLEKKGYEVTYEEFKSGHDYLSWGETLANGLIALIGY